METFEEFSARIAKIADTFPKSRLFRFRCRIRRWLYHSLNEPLQFEWVGNEGWPVGEPILIYHLTLHDMMAHEARGVLTDKVLLEGLRVNAFQHLGLEQLEQHFGRSTIQPRWVDA